jgi:aldose 1-epimerase
VEGEVSDLRREKVLHEIFKKLETGFEHYYIFDKAPGELSPVALFKDPEFSRTLEVRSTEPGMLFYTGYYTSDLLRRESGDPYGRFRAFCCETGRYHNGPNIPDSPASTLKPGETYHSKTVFALSW